MTHHDPAEFDCAGCGRHIIAFGLTEPPADMLCSGCALIGPIRNKAVNDYQDGDITETEFKDIYENAPSHKPTGIFADP